MNAAIAKTEIALTHAADEPGPHHSPVTPPATSPGADAEPFLEEPANHRLYRRSVAYFFFGFGCNQHSIVTDEP